MSDERQNLPSASGRGSPANFQDLTGSTFGRLTVLERADSRKWTARWKCRCACGNFAEVCAGDLRSGHTKSCGCLVVATASALGKRRAVHGHAREGAISPTFVSWTSMQERCLNPKHKSYADYGGRGITICERWREFSSFLADMGERPPRTTLDRFPNAGGNYEPGNCRWATSKEQNNNRRGNRLVTFNGVTMTLSQWADRAGADAAIVGRRLDAGVPLDVALSRPVAKRTTRMVTVGGQIEPLTYWIHHFKLSRKTVHERLSRGWTPEKAVTTPANAKFRLK